jgi:glucokinase
VERQARPAIGLDLGGTKILALVVSAEGRVLARAGRPTPHRDRAALVDALVDCVREAVARAGLRVEDAAGVGVGAPGPTDPERGVLLEPPNLPPDCRDLPLRALLEPRLGVPVVVDNDANAAALGEHRYGAGRGTADMLYITISTGIGGGIVAGGRLLRGAGYTAGEVGHMILAAEGQDVCGCGRVGCWEAISSGTGIARQAREAVAAGRAPGLWARCGGDPAALTAAVVARAAAEGDPAAQAIVTRAVAYSGVGLLNLLHLFSPALIVIGGGLTHAWDQLIAPAARWALDHAVRHAAAACRIVRAELGDDVGGMGAAALVAAASRA